MIEEKKNITFLDIQKANETIKPMAIKRKNKETGQIISKDYAEVNQRIKAYRMVYPTGTITTEMLSNENGICIFKATITDEQGTILATGTAYEKETSSFINQTSYIENCETSAVGRALGMAGFGIDTSIVSAEEVQNAMNNQNETTKVIYATTGQIAVLAKVYQGDNLTKLLEANKITKLEELTIQKASDLIKKIKEREAKTNE